MKYSLIWFGLPPGLTERCSFCDRLGASVVCKEATCSNKYHFPCASGSGCFQDIKSLLLLCPKHVENAEYYGTFFLTNEFKYIFVRVMSNPLFVVQLPKTPSVLCVTRRVASTTNSSAPAAASTTTASVWSHSCKSAPRCALVGSVQSARSARRVCKFNSH